MPHISINLRDIGSGLEFDIPSVINHFRKVFSDLEVLSNDAYQEQLRAAKEVLSTENPAEAHVLRKIKLDQETQGPAVSFRFSILGHSINGVVKRRLVNILFDEPLSEQIVETLCSTMESASHHVDRKNIKIVNEFRG